MDFLLTYVLQVNLLLVIVYLGYTLLLKNLTFYQVNRTYFILGIGFSFFYPFMDIKALFRQHIEPVGEVIHYIPEFFVEQSAGTSVFTLNNLVLAGLIVGAGVFMIRLLIQLLSLLRIHLRSEPAVWKSFIYRNVLFPIVPFSFFNKIYINKQQHEDRELFDIFKHEDIHVKGRHTFDILFTEIVFITCWYNPVVWLMRKAVRQNLEFLTDQQVLDKGVDRQVYQYSLLNVSKQGTNAAIANQFNFKMLKRRIMMMNKKRSSKLELSKYVFLVPIFVFVAGAFTISKAEDKIEEVVGYAKSTDIARALQKPEVVENLKVDIGDVAEISNHKVDSLGFLLDGEVVTPEALEALGDNEIESAIVNFNNGLTEKYGFKTVLNVTTKKFAGTEGTPSKIKFVRFDEKGKLILGGPMQVAPSEEKSTFSSTMRYEMNQKDTAGVVVTAYGMKMDTVKRPQDKITSIRIRSVSRLKSDSLGNEVNPLLVLDGEPMPKGMEMINTINPNDIESISILKDGSATALYGAEGKDGVILIVTKAGGKSTARSGNKNAEIVVQGYANKSEEKPLVIVNGKEVSLDLNSIKTEQIESINTLTPEEATERYGDKGKQGAVVITTKRGEDLTLTATDGKAKVIVGTGRKMNTEDAEIRLEETVKLMRDIEERRK